MLFLLLLSCSPGGLDYWSDADPVVDFGIEDEDLVDGFERLRDWDLGPWPTETDLDPVLAGQAGEHPTAKLYNMAAALVDRVAVSEDIADRLYSFDEPNTILLHPALLAASPENIPPIVAYLVGLVYWGPHDDCSDGRCEDRDLASPYGTQALSCSLAYENCVSGHECSLWLACEAIALDHISSD